MTTAQASDGGTQSATVSVVTEKRAAGKARRPLLRAIPALTTLALALLWEILVRAGVLPNEVPPLTEVVDWLATSVRTGGFWESVRDTMIHWVGGLLVGSVFGIAFGLLLGAVPLLQRLLMAPVEFLRCIPSIVYLPLVLFLMGATTKVAILLVGIAVLWPMLFQTLYGMLSIEPVTRETAKVFGCGRRQLFLYVTLPSVLPYLATGIRIASTLALLVAVGVELVAGISGLGAELAIYNFNGAFPAMYGIVGVTGLIGVVLNWLFERLERSVLHWHVSQRSVDDLL